MIGGKQMKVKIFCKHCGQRVRARWESLSKGLVFSLEKLGKRVAETQRNKVHLQNDLSLTKNEYNNFQKLRYFGLAVKVENKAGYWLLTKRGLNFLSDEERVPKQVKVVDNRVVAYSGKTISIRNYYKDFETPYWLKKEDYIDRDQISLL